MERSLEGSQQQEQQVEGASLTDSRTGAVQGTVAVERIITAEEFWAQLRAVTTARDLAGIDAHLLATNEAGQLDRMIRYANPAQMDILYRALVGMQDGNHPPPIDDALWTIFAALPDSRPGMKRLCFRVRFRVNVVGRNLTEDNERDWDSAQLRRLWGIFAALPAAHVDRNLELDHFLRYESGGSGTGGYYRWDDIAAITFNPDTVGTQRQTGFANVRRGDPLENVNRFDKVVRHEVGHAVDNQLDASSQYCPQAGGGRWRTHTLVACVTEIMAEGGFTGMFSRPDLVATQLANRLTSQGDAVTPATLRASIPGLDDHPPAHQPRIGELLRLVAALQTTRDEWFRDAPRTTVGDRAFHRDGDSYYSYDSAARRRQVSNYQFRTPYEWFAEAYSAYYDPDSRGRGAKLAERDPTTKRWFDQHVHRADPSDTDRR